MTDFNTKDLDQTVKATTETRAEAQLLLENALLPFNEIEEKRERLLDSLAIAIVNDLIHRVKATDELAGKLPNISDVKDEVKTLIENKIAPKVQQGDKEKADSYRVSAIYGSSTDAMQGAYLVAGAGTGFEFGYYHNIATSGTPSYQHVEAKIALDDKGNLKPNYFKSIYWSPVKTFKKRKLDGQLEDNTSNLKHAKQSDIRKAFKVHFNGASINAEGTDLAINSKGKDKEENTNFCVVSKHLIDDYSKAVITMNALSEFFESDSLHSAYVKEDDIENGGKKDQPKPTMTAFFKLQKAMETAKNSLDVALDEARQEQELKQKKFKKAS